MAEFKHKQNPEGFKNRNDVEDQPTWKEIDQEVERELLHDQIQVHFNIEALDKEQREMLERWMEDVEETLALWKDDIVELIEDEKRISPRIREYLESKTLMLPRFDVYKKTDAHEFLNEIGFDGESIQERNFLVVFNLPKPLSQFWWKGGTELWGTCGEDVRKMVIEWGRIYRKVIRAVWDLSDNGRVPMERINPFRMHDPEKYYYLWEIGPESTGRYDAY